LSSAFLASPAEWPVWRAFACKNFKKIKLLSFYLHGIPLYFSYTTHFMEEFYEEIRLRSVNSGVVYFDGIGELLQSVFRFAGHWGRHLQI
jgi:hypothetical protein